MSTKFSIDIGELPTFEEVLELEGRKEEDAFRFRVTLAWLSDFQLVINGINILGNYAFATHVAIRQLSFFREGEVGQVRKVKMFPCEYPGPGCAHFLLVLESKGKETRVSFSWPEDLPLDPPELASLLPIDVLIDTEVLGNTILRAKESYFCHLKKEFPMYFDKWSEEFNDRSTVIP